MRGVDGAPEGSNLQTRATGSSVGASPASVTGSPRSPSDEVQDLENRALRQAWRNSAERARLFKRVIALGTCLVLGGAVVGALVSLVTYNETGEYIARTQLQSTLLYALVGLGLGVLAAVYGGILLRSFERRAFHDRYKLEQSRARLDEAEQVLVNSTSDTSFAALWTATQARLDHYHDIATSQSRRSFAYGQVAAATGLGVVLICTALAIVAESSAGAVVAGVLGGSAAAMSGYIGSTFLRTQDLAASQMRDYFGQPLEFSRFLAAERLLGEINDGERREAATVALIQAIARTPQPPG